MSKNNHYDLIVIGGGATGSGVALDSTLRGLKTLLVEKNDFSEGTSSRSTKLVHGGVRYLEKAVKKLDYAQYSLVKEGLKERYRLLNNAPHLAHPITLVTPLYKWYEIPYMYVGLALYDLISGKRRLGKSQIVSKKEIINTFPSVKKENLKGGVRYFDGAFNDARMVIALLQSAKENGCEIKNHTQVIDFVYEYNKISGVKLRNNLTQEQYEVTSDTVVDATGVFSNATRKLDEESRKNIVNSSSGIHIVIDKKFLPNEEGIMIPKTEDGRVLFMLPYLGKCLVGTTDESANVEDHPSVSQEDVDYLLRHIDKYFDAKVTKNDILSSWSGLRPLVINESINKTEEIVREHFIDESKSGLISIVGGKWTTYRKMAEDVIDYIAKTQNRKNLHTCQTKEFKLVGSRQNLYEVKEKLDKLNLEKDLILHLVSYYGDCSLEVCKYIEKYGLNKIHKDYPYLEAEVYYSIEHEFTCKPLDFLVRRVGLGFIDVEATKESLEKVSLLYKSRLDWNDKEFIAYLQEAKAVLEISL